MRAQARWRFAVCASNVQANENRFLPSLRSSWSCRPAPRRRRHRARRRGSRQDAPRGGYQTPRGDQDTSRRASSAIPAHRRQAARPSAEDGEFPQHRGGKERRPSAHQAPLLPLDGKFPCKLNSWEEKVLDEALAEKGAVGWLRNDPRKEWSFSIAYQKGGEDRPMYPDLLIFRRDGAGILCDIYEPHAMSYGDSVSKAKGLVILPRTRGEIRSNSAHHRAETRHPCQAMRRRP